MKGKWNYPKLNSNLSEGHMDYICAKFHQNLSTLLVEAYDGALHGSLQD